MTVVPGLYELKTMEELGMRHNSSFNAIGGRGVDWNITLRPNEIKLIRSVPDNDALWEGWATNKGFGKTIYYNYIASIPEAIWGIILMSSTPDYRQVVKVKDVSPDGKRILIDGIPYQANGDYSAWTIDKHPEMWVMVFAANLNGRYGPSHINKDGVPRYFRMPLFDPASGFKTHKGVDGLWVDTNVIYMMQPDVPDIPDVPGAPAMTYERRVINGLVCHVHTLDVAQVKPFVTPLVYQTAQEAKDKYGLKLVINGDGWKFTNPNIPNGRSMSNGVWYFKTNNEASIWFGAKHQAAISYWPPLTFAPTNVISFPKQMIVNGKIPKTFDNTYITARQSFSISQDGKKYIIITIEGVQETRIGATEKLLADLLLAFGAWNGVELDSGGSTQFADVDGNSYSSDVPARRTINQLGFTW